MAKRLKKSIESAEAEFSPPPAAHETDNSREPAVAATKTSAKRASAPRKTATAGKKRKPAARKKAAPAELAISDDEIRLRAYFIAETRIRDGVAGDSETDWLEARSQLLQEAAGQA